MSTCLPVYLSMYLSNCLIVYLSIYLFIYLILFYLISSYLIPSHPILSYLSVCPYVCLFVCLSACLSVILSIYLSVFLSFCPHVFLFVFVSIQSVYLSIGKFVYLSVYRLCFYLSIFFTCICLSMDLSFYLKERNYATRASKVEVNMPKSTYFCETSSKNESSEL